MFNIEWENEFLFIENATCEAQCLVCYRILGQCRKYNLERHYRSCHKNFAEISGTERDSLILQLKEEFWAKNRSDSGALTVAEKNRQIKKASVVAGLLLAKQCRPFEDGEFFKIFAKDVFECFGQKGKEAFEILESVPLSRQTITRRTEKISEHIFSCIKQKLQQCEYYSLCLDESTDISDTSQLIIYARGVNKDFDIFEEFVTLVPFHGHVNGKTLFDAVNEYVFSFADPKKLCSVCTDGAKVMVGKENGFVGVLMQHNINIMTFHRIIHQHALFAKNLHLVQTMDKAVQLINKIRGGHNSLSHRKFKALLEDLESSYGDLLMHTEVRWLSRGKCLERLFNLRQEVQLFLANSNKTELKELANAFEDPEFLLDLAFLCDITELINQFNVALQGRNKTIFDQVSCSHQFLRKLQILSSQLNDNNLSNLTRTAEILSEVDNNSKINEYQEILNSLVQNYGKRFKDFDSLKDVISIHNDPFNAEISNANEYIRTELQALKQDMTLPLGSGLMFWQNLNIEKYPVLKNEILKLYSMFASTYDCESGFSIFKLIKNKYRNKLTDNHVCDLLRIKLCQTHIDVDQII